MMIASQQLNALNNEIALLQYGQHPVELYEPIRYIMDLGGKRLRPMFTLLSSYLYTDSWQLFLKPAIAVEVFHNFTLMHDDIMDQAPLRRGKPTVHQKWNASTAILSGDVMLVSAYELLLDVQPEKLRPVLERFNRCAAEVCEGQQLDMNYESEVLVSQEAYLEMIKLKTAVLLGFSLELGGIMAGALEKDTRLLREMGINIGMGFQLKDDLLDVYGEQAKFGKQVGGDILANKKTFLLLKALQSAKGDDEKELNRWISSKAFDPEEKVKAVTAIYDTLHIRTITETTMNEYFALGLNCLEKVQAPAARKEPLKAFVEQLIYREN